MNDKPSYLSDEEWAEFQQQQQDTGPPPARDQRDFDEGVQLGDFVAFMQAHDYIFKPSGDLWPAARVNARLPKIKLTDRSGQPMIDEKTGAQKEIRPSDWLAKHAPVEQMTWAPGLPQLIKDKLISEGGWSERKGVTVFNLYRPPRLPLGDATKAERWLDHWKRIYPHEADHIIAFLAHRVQKPYEKINHGLVLGGDPGIGKDTQLEPIKYAVGPWNFTEVSPQQAFGRFNGFLKSVVLRISEAKDMGEFDRFKFYDHMKTYLAAPPDVLRVDEKNLREHSVVNVCGVVMTTNEETNGIYLPPNDRRHFVAWSDIKLEDFPQNYWSDYWRWYEAGGYGHVAAYLANLDISNFDPKAPPKKTSAFWAIADANRAPENVELADAIDEIARRLAAARGEPIGDNAPVKIVDRPPVLTIAKIAFEMGQADISEWLLDRKNRRAIPHRFKQCGYVIVRNDIANDGLFVIRGRRQAVYGRYDLSVSERLRAASGFVKRQNK